MGRHSMLRWLEKRYRRNSANWLRNFGKWWNYSRGLAADRSKERGRSDCLLKTQDFAKFDNIKYKVWGLPNALKLKEQVNASNWTQG